MWRTQASNTSSISSVVILREGVAARGSQAACTLSSGGSLLLNPPNWANW